MPYKDKLKAREKARERHDKWISIPRNRKRKNKKTRENYYLHHERELNRGRKKRIKYREQIKEYHKRIYCLNKKKMDKANRQWLIKNREKRNKWFYSYIKKKPQLLLGKKLRTRLWCALQKYKKTGKIIKAEKYKLNYKLIIPYLITTMPKNNFGWDIEHKIPLVCFDLTKQSEVDKAFAPKNLQWLKHTDNLKKGIKIE